MWYCYEVSFRLRSPSPTHYYPQCHAEMRPLMVRRNPPKLEIRASDDLHQVPDPHCASCNGTFVEKVGGRIHLLPQLMRLLFRLKASRMIHAVSRRPGLF